MDARNIIDYAFDDNAKEMRESLYASIYDRVTAAFEAKKQELAHNLVGMPMSTESVEMELDEEQLDELSPQTLGSYVKKAGQSASDSAENAGRLKQRAKGEDIYGDNRTDTMNRHDVHKANQAKRVGGIATAVGKMMNQKIKS